MDYKYPDLEKDALEAHGSKRTDQEMAKSPRSSGGNGERAPSFSRNQVLQKAKRTLLGAGTERTQVLDYENEFSVWITELRNRFIGTRNEVPNEMQSWNDPKFGNVTKLSAFWGTGTLALLATESDIQIVLELRQTNQQEYVVTGVRVPVIGEIHSA